MLYLRTCDSPLIPALQNSLSFRSLPPSRDLGHWYQRKWSSMFIWFSHTLFHLIGSWLGHCLSTRLEKKGEVVFKSSLSLALASESQPQWNSTLGGGGRPGELVFTRGGTCGGGAPPAHVPAAGPRQVLGATSIQDGYRKRDGTLLRKAAFWNKNFT